MCTCVPFQKSRRLPSVQPNSLSFPDRADVCSAGEKKSNISRFMIDSGSFPAASLLSSFFMGLVLDSITSTAVTPLSHPLSAPQLPADIYRGLVCQACCLSVCVTLFLTLPSCSVCLGLCACGGVCVTAGLSFGLTGFFFSFFWATHWPSGNCRFLYIFLTPFSRYVFYFAV